MDILKQLDKRLEWDNRMIGQQTMQVAVLRWAADNRPMLPMPLRESLIRTMQGSLDAAMVERPVIQTLTEESTCSRG